MKPIAPHSSATTYEAGILQSKAHRAFTTFLADALQRDTLSVPQWTVLGILYEGKEKRPFQIAERLGVRPPVVTAIINELEAEKLIMRKVHASDSRATVIVLTRQGKQLVTKTERRLQKEMQEFLSDITLPEQAVYLRVLAKLAAKG